MQQLEEMVTALKKVFNGRFIYGSYHEKPNALPYGNYAEDSSDYIHADDVVYHKIKTYIVRAVTETKNFDLEDQIEAVFESLKMPYAKVTDVDILSEHVMCAEWLVTAYF